MHIWFKMPQPRDESKERTKIMLNDLLKYKPRIEARAHALIPAIRWDGFRRKVRYI